jgi:drug/metabolite transporter (DMT)-like permease
VALQSDRPFVKGTSISRPVPHVKGDPASLDSLVPRTAVFCVLALLGFAANSLLTRLALRPGLIDAASFMWLRLTSGALALTLLSRLRRPAADLREGSWASALLLFGYAAPFSYAYLRIGAGLGALVLFGTVQLTMIGWGLIRGERPQPGEWGGLFVAFAGLATLTLPGSARPNALSFVLMVCAGIAWGAYSLRGRRSGDPLAATAGNFLRSVPLASLLVAALLLTRGVGALHVTSRGALLAIASGAAASGVAYSFWYAALPGLTALRAALIQLTVPVVAALGAIVLLDERPSARLAGATVAVLGGVAWALLMRAKRPRRG